MYNAYYLAYQVKIHYTLEGSTEVVATISANVATIDFIMKGLPGQPEGMHVLCVYWIVWFELDCCLV